jgi:polysaccharide biosynthesis transport protein
MLSPSQFLKQQPAALYLRSWRSAGQFRYVAQSGCVIAEISQSLTVPPYVLWVERPRKFSKQYAPKSRAIEPQVVVSPVDQRTSSISVLGEARATVRFPASAAGEHLLDKGNEQRRYGFRGVPLGRRPPAAFDHFELMGRTRDISARLKWVLEGKALEGSSLTKFKVNLDRSFFSRPQHIIMNRNDFGGMISAFPAEAIFFHGQFEGKLNMLQFNEAHSAAKDYGHVVPEANSSAETLENLLGILRRQYAVIVFVGVLTMALALIYVVTATPRYKAVATMFIDRGKVQPFAQQQQMVIENPIDSGAMDGQIEILKSDAIALSVINSLHLTDDPEFGGSIDKYSDTRFGWFFGLFHSNVRSSSFDDSRVALASFEERLSVNRVGISFMIAINFVSNRPDRAAQIANAIVEAYINDQLEAKYEITRRANDWLQSRLGELQQQATTADHALADFKAKNNLVNVGNGQFSDEQQVSQLNIQLAEARAQTSTAQARLDRIERIINSAGDINDTHSAGTVADTLNSAIITQLRTKYLDLVNREADLSNRLGNNHLAVVNVQRQIRETRSSILDELKRFSETYKSDFEIAKQRQADVEKRLASAVSDSHSVGQAQGTLKELESKARTYHSLYDNLLQRYTELTQQESLPMTEARFITRASPPREKAYPKTRLILAGALFAGLALGFGVGLLREMLDSVFRTTKQVVAALHTNCLAVIPLAETARSISATPKQKQFESTGLRTISRDATILWTVNDFPLSRFAEAVRAVKLAVDLGVAEQSRVIGITSAIPDEGKSTISANLAVLMAQVGARVLLVDGDLRNPSLSRALAPRAACGLLDVISGNLSLEEAVWTDASTNLAFLPSAMPFRLTDSNEFFSNNSTKHFFKELRQRYDYVVVDLSPLAPVIDVRATTNLVDAYLLVVEWGRTKIKLVEHALNEADNVYENLLGVVLNKANMDKVHRYDGYLGSYYRNKHFARYYTD